MKSVGDAGRLPLVDAFKALGAQFIVLHHLAFYGPLSDGLYQFWPEVVTWFSQDARMAVQVFLVVAGFLAARSLAPQGLLRAGSVWQKVGQRYVRVALPYLAALLLSVWCAAWARAWMVHDSIPDPATAWQWLTHALLLHSVLGVDSLSAGVWYVAIDFQLYVLLLVLLWCAQGWAVPRLAALGLVLLGVLASVFHFNRDAEWDVWALYFFGAYGLGALTYWLTRSQSDAPRLMLTVWVLLLLTVVLALVVDFRERIALALMVALCLGSGQRGGWLGTWPRSRALSYLSRISYSVFLLNFPVALVVNAWFVQYAPATPEWQSVGVLVAWLACNLAGALFHHGVETRLSQLSWPQWRAMVTR